MYEGREHRAQKERKKREEEKKKKKKLFQESFFLSLYECGKTKKHTQTVPGTPNAHWSTDGSALDPV